MDMTLVRTSGSSLLKQEQSQAWKEQTRSGRSRGISRLPSPGSRLLLQGCRLFCGGMSYPRLRGLACARRVPIQPLPEAFLYGQASAPLRPSLHTSPATSKQPSDQSTTTSVQDDIELPMCYSFKGNEPYDDNELFPPM